MAHGFTNQGLINLGATGSAQGSTSRLYVESGTLVNAAAGTIETTGAALGGGRELHATVDNQGLIDASPYGLYWVIDRGSGLSTNEGTINLNGVGFEVQYSELVNTGTITLTGGTLYLDGCDRRSRRRRVVIWRRL